MRLSAALALLLAFPAVAQHDDFARLRSAYVHEVDRRLEVPPDEQQRYARDLDAALAGRALAPQYVLLVDRAAAVQAALLYAGSPASGWQLVGASPVSTGQPGRVDYFLTPLGVFEHSVQNMDYRALGTRNALGVRGYGVKGMRVYDFGWALGERGWGGGGMSQMRLQMHATDPDLLEPWLGQRRSKGCIRIPASLNVFLDRHGLLDADYEEAVAAGARLWVLLPDRQPAAGAGRYLVVVDSQRAQRPAWSPAPRIARRAASTPLRSAC